MIPFNEMPNHSRVWIYQSDRAFMEDEAKEIELLIQQFAQSWKSHNINLKASAIVLYNRFIIFAVDHHYESPSGCSIDSSVAMIKEIENLHGVNMFDRMKFAWKADDNNVKVLPRADFIESYKKGEINNDTIVFNNLVQTKAEMLEKWQIEFSRSWFVRLL